MAAFKLTYFPFYGRAEAIRMLFVHAKADWIDEIIPVPEFAARKAAGEFPNGQIPILAHKGRILNESVAILRYVGKELGYYPADNLEAWYVDSLIDFVKDSIDKILPIVFGKRFDEAGLAEYSQVVIKFCAFYEKHLK